MSNLNLKELEKQFTELLKSYSKEDLMNWLKNHKDDETPEIESMNIYAKHGDKVKFYTYSAGYDYEKEKVKNFKIGDIFTVDYTVVHSWHTDVYFIELPGIKYNSAFFQDYKI